MEEIFLIDDTCHYNLRNTNIFRRPRVNSVYYGTESLSFLGPKVWDILPEYLKEIGNLETFKTLVKQWYPINCPCRCCKIFVADVGFIQTAN